MRRWSGKSGTASLPEKIEKELAQRVTSILQRRNVPEIGIAPVVQEIVDEVSYACAGRNHILRGELGRGPDAPAALLSVNIADLLAKHGLKGNWAYCEDDGVMGLTAELEAIAQTAMRQALGSRIGILARPARISEARKTLGLVSKN